MPVSSPRFDSNFKATDFSLPDVISDKTVSLSEADLSNGFVVAFICNHCPYVKALIGEFVETANALKAENVPVFAIMSNNYEFVEADSPENMKEFAAEHSFSFPYLLDEDQSVAKSYEAVCTPDIFGFAADRSLQYRGSLDGLEAAMLMIKQTGTGPTEQTPSSGCSVKWK